MVLEVTTDSCRAAAAILRRVIANSNNPVFNAVPTIVDAADCTRYQPFTDGSADQTTGTASSSGLLTSPSTWARNANASATDGAVRSESTKWPVTDAVSPDVFQVRADSSTG